MEIFVMLVVMTFFIGMFIVLKDSISHDNIKGK